jgi:hypothetical protein
MKDSTSIIKENYHKNFSNWPSSPTNKNKVPLTKNMLTSGANNQIQLQPVFQRAQNFKKKTINRRESIL